MNNPIGALQEMCMSRHWPPPKYTMEGEEGLPHERQFTIVCSILKYREVGQGKSKKVAKRHAAHKMWQALHDMNNQTPTVDEDEVRICIVVLLTVILNNEYYMSICTYIVYLIPVVVAILMFGYFLVIILCDCSVIR